MGNNLSKWDDNQKEMLRQLAGSIIVPAGQSCYASVSIPHYETTNLRSLIEESARLTALMAEYDSYEIEVPKDLVEARERNGRFVKQAHRAELERKLKEAEALVEELRSQEEKRAAAEQEVENLRRLLSEGR